MNLLHYAHEEIALDRQYRRQSAHNGSRIMKPSGLWVSVEDEYGWRDWCLDQDYGLDRLTHVHEVVLKPDAKILYLKTTEDVVTFHKNFSFDMLNLLHDQPRARPGMIVIAWENVAEDYQGIIISPYSPGDWLRYDVEMLWYHSWDCASGCIWDFSAIESITLREVVPEPKTYHYRYHEATRENHEETADDVDTDRASS